MVETRNEVVTLAGFRAWTHMTVSEAQEPIVRARLALYQSQAESLIRRPCSAVVTDEIVTDIVGGMLVTRRRPVATVTEISPEVSTHLTSGGVIALDILPTLTGYDYADGGSYFTVSYTSALRPEDLDTVIACCYERMARAFVRIDDDAEGVQSVNEEGYGITLYDPGWLQSEIEALRHMAGRTSR